MLTSASFARHQRKRPCGCRAAAATVALAVAVLCAPPPASAATGQDGIAGVVPVSLQAPTAPSGAATVAGDSEIRARLAGAAAPVIAGERLDAALLDRFYAA